MDAKRLIYGLGIAGIAIVTWTFLYFLVSMLWQNPILSINLNDNLSGTFESPRRVSIFVGDTGAPNLTQSPCHLEIFSGFRTLFDQQYEEDGGYDGPPDGMFHSSVNLAKIGADGPGWYRVIYSCGLRRKQIRISIKNSGFVNVYPWPDILPSWI